MDFHTGESMLKLEQVSKIYSAHGVISTGFNKVSLEFETGEFVAITGESGSGKSTLLNVISGLDSYEEGEMYIMGKATSGFTKDEMETYRKEYIGNIFQSFNLINSYTVYQNVELVLLMSGYKKSEVKERVKSIISQVGLSDYEKTKASKLSGGQKQRVAIARALAKETPIIVADEPTGNLDSKSAADIIKLLHEISKDKLIIIVTHNYEQVEDYVTRKIQMHDGEVIEDKRFTEREKLEIKQEEKVKKAKADTLSFGNMLRLSTRNTFNLPAKLLLLLAVFLFLCSGVISSYTTSKDLQNIISNEGYNSFFNDTRDERLLITKQDRSLITEEDYSALKKIPNVDEIVRQDFFLDTGITLVDVGTKPDEGNNIFISASLKPIGDKKFNLVDGRMPQNENEAILVFQDEEYSYLKDIIKEVMKSSLRIENWNNGATISKENIKVVGYAYTKNEVDEMNKNGNLWIEAILYGPEQFMDKMNYSILEGYCSQELEFANTIVPFKGNEGPYSLKVSDKVDEGEVYIPEDIDNFTERRTIGMPFILRNKSIYFEDSYEYTVGAVYKKNNLEYLLGRTDFDEISGSIFMNPSDYAKMFNKGNYQSSVFIKDVKAKEETIKKIEAKGYKVFNVGNARIALSQGMGVISKVLYTGIMGGALIVLFFVSYFIIKLILKSRNIYFSTIRMIGATKKNCASMLRTELFIIFNLAFFICGGAIALVKYGVVDIPRIYDLASILVAKDYIILYLLLCVISIMLAGRYARQMFKKVAMDAYREEV